MTQPQDFREEVSVDEWVTWVGVCDFASHFLPAKVVKNIHIFKRNKLHYCRFDSIKNTKAIKKKTDLQSDFQPTAPNIKQWERKSTSPQSVAVTAFSPATNPLHEWRRLFSDFLCASTVCRLLIKKSKQKLFHFVCPGNTVSQKYA